MWDGLFFGMYPTLYQQECNLTVSRRHYLFVPTSSVSFPHNELNQGIGVSHIQGGVDFIKMSFY